MTSNTTSPQVIQFYQISVSLENLFVPFTLFEIFGGTVASALSVLIISIGFEFEGPSFAVVVTKLLLFEWLCGDVLNSFPVVLILWLLLLCDKFDEVLAGNSVILSMDNCSELKLSIASYICSLSMLYTKFSEDELAAFKSDNSFDSFVSCVLFVKSNRQVGQVHF